VWIASPAIGEGYRRWARFVETIVVPDSPAIGDKAP
jgi:hypothetical protein